MYVPLLVLVGHILVLLHRPEREGGGERVEEKRKGEERGSWRKGRDSGRGEVFERRRLRKRLG